MNFETIEKPWRRLDGTRLEGKLLANVEAAIIREKEAGHKLKLCVGTDSQVKGDVAEFATVIVFLREKKGGFMFNTDPAFKSNTALKEAMGYILGMGFVFKAKPDAFASSSCADKVV